MNRMFFILPALCAVAGSAAAQQPLISAGGIVNSASYTPQALSGGIAQGSIFSVFGSGMGPATAVSSRGFPLPTTLGGTTVSVTSGAVTVPAYLFYVAAGQLSGVLPSNVPVGAATLTVTSNGTASAPASFQVVQSAFGAFTLASSGQGAGIFTTPQYQLYGLAYAAQPGETVTMWGTGVGPVSGNEAASPLPGDLTFPVQVFVGGQTANVVYRGRSGCCAGLDQLAFVVPANISGCHVPIAVQIGDTVSNFVTMPIATGTRTCSDPAVPTGIDISTLSSQSTVAIGFLSFSRDTSSLDLGPPVGSSTTTTDIGIGDFVRYTAAQFATTADPFGLNINTFGACSVYTFSASLSTITTIPTISATQLDAGAALTVNGPNGSKQLTKETVGTSFLGYYSQLGGGFTLPGATTLPLYLDGGNYTVTGTGGADVGAFTANFTVPASLTWTNQASVTTVMRAQGQPVTWTGGDPNGSVLITGSSFVLAAGATSEVGATFTCTVPTTAQQFTIPSEVLLSLPTSTATLGIATGYLAVSATPVPAQFSASGIDAGLLAVGISTTKNVNYQ